MSWRQTPEARDLFRRTIPEALDNLARLAAQAKRIADALDELRELRKLATLVEQLAGDPLHTDADGRTRRPVELPDPPAAPATVEALRQLRDLVRADVGDYARSSALWEALADADAALARELAEDD